MPPTTPPAYLVECIGTLYAPHAAAWQDDTWQYRVAGALHEEAAHMDRKRSRRPFTARDLSEREWYAQRRDPAVIAAAEAAYAAHKIVTPPPKARRARRRTVNPLLAAYAAAVGGISGER